MHLPTKKLFCFLYFYKLGNEEKDPFWTYFSAFFVFYAYDIKKAPSMNRRKKSLQKFLIFITLDL